MCPRDKRIPGATKEAEKWLSHRPDAAGFSWSFSTPFGGGGLSKDKQIPTVGDAASENFYEIFRTVVDEARENLGIDSILVSIENLESLDVREIANVFMALRDTFFITPGVIFVIMGKSDLLLKLETYDKRVTQRVRQPAISIRPFNSSELHQLVKLRVKKCRESDAGMRPLSEEMHDVIFEAAQGIPRLALQRSDELINLIFSDAYRVVVECMSEGDQSLTKEALTELVTDAIEATLIEKQIPNGLSHMVLVQRCLTRLGVNENEAKELAQEISAWRFGNETNGKNANTLAKIVSLLNSDNQEDSDDNGLSQETFGRKILSIAV